MRRAALLLTVVLGSQVHAQPPALAGFAERVGLGPGDAATVTRVDALGVSVPGGALSLRVARPVLNLELDKLRGLEQLPAQYGTRCLRPQDLTLVPVDVLQVSATAARWLRETSALTLQRSGPQSIFLKEGQDDPVLGVVLSLPGMLAVLSCPVASPLRLSSGYLLTGEYTARPPTLVAFDVLGALAWCAPGQTRPVRNVQAYAGGVGLATRSPDGERVATVGYDRGGAVLKLWRSADARLLGQAAVSGIPRSLSFSPDGRALALFTTDGAARPKSVVVRYAADTGREEARLTLPEGEGPVAVGQGGEVVATAGVRNLRLRDLTAQGRVRWTVPVRWRLTYAFSRGGAWLGGVDGQGLLTAWATASGKRATVVDLESPGPRQLKPGVRDGEFSVVTVQGLSVNSPGRRMVQAWTPEPSRVTELGAVDVEGETGVALDAASGQPTAIGLCNAGEGLPRPVSSP